MGRTSLPRFPIPTGALVAVLVAGALALHSGPAAAQMKINEIYPDPAGVDDPLERVEIYNAGSVAVDVTGWGIHDAASIDGSPALRCRLPEDFDTAACPGGAIIQPGEFRLVKATVVAAWLNQGGDDIYLCSNRTIPAVIVDQVTYPSSTGHTDETWAALPNGSTNFAWRTKSLCGTNGTLGDVDAPGTVSDLLAAAGAKPGEIRLTWTAPGDDGATGTASAYLIKVAHSPITALSFDACAPLERWIDVPLPLAGATPETLVVFGMDPDSTYYFALEAQDEIPNTSAISNSPGSAPHAGVLLDPDVGFTPYFGNLHSHTSYSDGVQTPADAYFFARNTAPTPLDFLEVSEHNHVSAGMQLSNYPLGRSQAASANDDGNFVAIYGQEWGLASHGHVIVVDAPVLFGWDAGQYDVFVAEGDYAGLYTAALANPPSGSPAILELCHPASGDFDNLAVTPDGLAAVKLMALVNGPSMSTATDESDIGNTGFDGQFQEALRKGFRVSPTGDQDNHNATWGAATESRTAVLATARTKAEILSGLAARRCYATQDHNVRVDFSADGHAMGAAFTATEGIRIAAEVTDPDLADGVGQIDLYRGITGTSNATLIAGNVGSSTFQWRDLSPPAVGVEAHYYLRIRMNDNQNIWTGPVYVTYEEPTPVSVGDGPGAGPRLTLIASPNPTRGGLSADFSLPRNAGRVRLAVYDLGGRRVRSLLDRPLDAGAHHVAWDGLADDGTRPPAGIFFLRLEAGSLSAARKVLRLN